MNKDLNVFKVMSKEQKTQEVIRLEKVFPSNYPNYLTTLGPVDVGNLYIGRIISLLDEFGETKDWDKYFSIDMKKTIKNYDDLMLRYIKEIRPELLSEYIEYHDIE